MLNALIHEHSRQVAEQNCLEAIGSKLLHSGEQLGFLCTSLSAAHQNLAACHASFSLNAVRNARQGERVAKLFVRAACLQLFRTMRVVRLHERKMPDPAPAGSPQILVTQGFS